MEIKNKKIKQYSKPCKICNIEIKGFSESQVDYNMKLHLEKHEKEEVSK